MPLRRLEKRHRLTSIAAEVLHIRRSDPDHSAAVRQSPRNILANQVTLLFFHHIAAAVVVVVETVVAVVVGAADVSLHMCLVAQV